MDSIKQARKLFERTRVEHFALGAFNADNQETMLAIVRAAKAKNSPALIELSQTEVEAIGLTNARDLTDNYKKEYGVEIYLNLDHAPSVELAKSAIDAGYEFIHLDVSKDTTVEKNIVQTKEVVEYAKKTGALIESEMEYFLGSSNVHNESVAIEEIKKHYTDPTKAKQFIEATGIDTFAASVGNLHGLYPLPKVLNLKLLKEIRSSINCYISLHGGSGTPSHFYKEAIAIGISKININSDMRRIYRNTLEQELDANPDEFAVIKLMPDVIKAVQEVIEEKMDLFGSTGKATLYN